MHLAGAGLLLFSKGGVYAITLDLVPIQLVFTTLILLKYQKSWSLSFGLFIISAFFIGFIAEAVGVNTGWPFGEYSYGEVLGIKYFETPLIIGLNWFLLAYLAGNISSYLKAGRFIKILVGVFLMVIFDYFMEPIAMKHAFWTWKDGYIPVQNYLGWAGVSFLILLIYHFGDWEKGNPLARWIFLVMFLFFMIQNFF